MAHIYSDEGRKVDAQEVSWTSMQHVWRKKSEKN